MLSANVTAKNNLVAPFGHGTPALIVAFQEHRVSEGEQAVHEARLRTWGWLSCICGARAVSPVWCDAECIHGA